jgi:hypothetical protein
MAKSDRKQASKPRKQPIATFSNERFDKAVESHPRAKRALALMMAQGRSGQKILALLRFSVEQEHMPKGFAAVQRETGLSQKRIDTIASGHKQAASQVTMLIEYGRVKSDDPDVQRQLDEIYPPALHHLAAQSPVKQFKTIAGQTISSEEGFALLPELDRAFSVVLKSSWPRKWVRSGRLDMQFMRNASLFCAVSMARKALGKPCYPDLAALIEAYNMAMGTDKTVEPGTLEKAYAGFKRRYPEEAAQQEEAPWMHE